MENTGKVLFEDDTPQWYIALGERWVGPMAASDVYQKVLSQEITWAHFVWKPGQPNWERLCDTPTFQAAVPSAPAKSFLNQVKEASRPNIRAASAPGKSSTKATARGAQNTPPPPAEKGEERIWFLYYNDSQFGPFSSEEISRFLRVGKIHGRVHIWKDGMNEWARLETIPRFAADVEEAKKVREQKKASSGAPKAPSKPKEQRSAPRRPLVAKIILANQDNLTVAVCRDISVGGMQVLTDRIPGVAGTRIKMNVSPAGKAEKGEKTIEPFVAEGVIVRILEDGRGFSFRFDRLPESSRRIIEDYIKAE